MNGRYIALDLRALDRQHGELFRLQLNADLLLPVASCFKAFVVPWYYLTVPQSDWVDGPESPVWEMAVHSRNYFTAVVLDQVARNVPGEGNAIEKFNDFLLSTGMRNGIYLWRGGPTRKFLDSRFKPSRSTGRMVRLGERQIPIYNVFTARDLANRYDFLTRGGESRNSPEDEIALQRARALLGRPEKGLLSPIERAYSPGYIGKHGAIGPNDIPTGFVLNYAGLVKIDKMQFIIAFMSVAEFEGDAMSALREIVQHAILLERELRQAPATDIPRVRG
ncbi:MAG: hypothetical protein J4G17_06915 [Anaerolineae bacterium]|nr:hypothetical protein [Anaerolineae bacterium]